MPDFQTAIRDMAIRGSNTGAVPDISGLSQQAAAFGAPTAGALAAATPNPPAPGMGAAPSMPPMPQIPGMTPEMMANPATAALVGQLYGGGGAGMGGPPSPQPPVQAGGSMLQALGDMLPPMGEDTGVGGYTSPPQVGIAQPDESYPQSFYSANGRYPTKHDYAEREWSIDFTRRLGRYPTKLEFVLQFTPPGVSDGQPEFS